MAVVCTLYIAKPPILFYPFSLFVILFCPHIDPDPDPDPDPHPDPHQLHTFIPKNQKRYGTTFQCAVCPWKDSDSICTKQRGTNSKKMQNLVSLENAYLFVKL